MLYKMISIKNKVELSFSLYDTFFIKSKLNFHFLGAIIVPEDSYIFLLMHI